MPPHEFGLLGVSGDAKHELHEVALESVNVQVKVRGFVAHTAANLHYRNTKKTALQVYLRLPVEASAALYHVEATLDGRTFRAHCMERSKAERLFKDAVSAGKTGVLVREEDYTADIITLMLGNLPAEATAVVKVSLVCELTVAAADGGVQFTLPTLLNPRYGPHPPDNVGSLSPSCWEEEVECGWNQVMRVSLPYVLGVEATVTGGGKIASIKVHNELCDITMDEGETTAKLRQEGGMSKDQEWGFVVYYNNPYTPLVLLERGDPAAVGLMRDQVLVLSMFPELPQRSFSHRNEIIFVVDRSGSMEGDNIASARAVLLLLLKSLPQGCLFNVISFGSHHSMLFSGGSKQYSEETLKQACVLQAGMQADMGGTEILPALSAIYATAPTQGYARQVLVLTDGAVANVDAVVALVRRNANNTRVFAVGVGPGASSALVGGLARAGGGRAEMITQKDRVQLKVMGLVASMVQASAMDVRVSCEVAEATRVHFLPPVPPIIFSGHHLTAYARLPHNAQLISVRVTGSVEGETFCSSVSQDQIKTIHDESLSLHRLAARAHILHYQGDDSEGAGAREEVIETSITSGVLSRYTALLAVDDDGIVTPRERVVRGYNQCDNRAGARNQSYCDTDSASTVAFTALQNSRIMSLCNIADCGEIQDEEIQDEEIQDEDLCCSFVQPVLVKKKRARKRVSYLCRNTSTIVTSMQNLKHEKGIDKNGLFLQLVSLQKFDGSWTCSDICSLLNVKEDDLKIDDVKDTTVAATVAAVALLRGAFASQEVEWRLIVTKALAWVARQEASKWRMDEGSANKSGDQQIELLIGQKATNLWASLRVKHAQLEDLFE